MEENEGAIVTESELEMEEVVTAGAGISAKTDAAIDIENPHNKVMNDIRERIRKLSPPPSNKICIYRVPENIRNLNEGFYTPVVVSIGPYHHDNPNFEFMENCKWRYFQTFIAQSNISLQRYVELMKDSEERARANYAETINWMNSDEFVTMMLVDGCFILELMRSCGVRLATEVNKFIFSKNWLITRILLDLILLENQIPFFILESIYHLAFPYDEPKNDLYRSILNLFLFGPDILNFSRSQNSQNKSPADFENVLHFTDLIRKLYLPDMDFSGPADSDSEIKFVYTATQLYEAGVKFKKAGSSNCLLDVKFKGGVLEFPRLTLQNETEYIFRNLVALEVCHYSSHATPIIDYVVFLDSLIDTRNDVDLLGTMGMLYNGVGSTREASEIINDLCTEVTYYSKKSYLIPVCKKLNAYYNLPMNRWRTVLKRDYFRTPWRTASTLAAIMLLLLTLIQTIFSLLSFPQGG